MLSTHAKRFIGLAVCATLVGGYYGLSSAESDEKPQAQGISTAISAVPISIQQNNEFRDDVMHFVKKAAADAVAKQKTQADESMDKHWVNGGHPVINWAMEVAIYFQGNLVGRGNTNARSLSQGLIKASNQAVLQANLNDEQLRSARFKVTFYYPPDSRQYSFVDEGDKSAELIGNVVPVREMNTTLLRSRILSEKAYLLRVMDPQTHGFFKRYDASTDKHETRLRTTYTASSLFTLLKINSVFPDPEIEKLIQPIGDYLLMMQEHEGENAGAFHYSYNKETQEKDNRFVVGTVSKTIYTLLLLNEKTHDPKYLAAAKQAGNWLITKVDDKGYVYPVLHLNKKNQKWIQIKKQSFLYSGQVLSALSRLYAVTNDKAYYDKATLIAKRFVEHVENKGPFVGDDFRIPNSVSTSWMVMSLVDYAKINKEVLYRDVISKSANQLVIRQASDTNDAFNEGRVVDLISASGNGWVNEVMTVLYPFCTAEKMEGCESYRSFIVNSSRWLMQNVYTPVNSFAIKNPAVADGGAIPNFLGVTVRTDAVCHGGNSLVGLMEMMGSQEQTYMVLPEMSFEEVLTLLGIGKFPAIGMTKIDA